MVTRRSRSPVSDDGDPTNLVSPRYLKESSIFKSIGSDKIEDDYPCFILRDTTIYNRDGDTFGNLLNAELEGPYIVRGQIAFDEDEEHIDNLRQRKYKNEHVEIKTEAFSIAGDPITLWARGTYRWLEIWPSTKYEDTYKHMMDGIHIYFTVASIYEKPHSRKKGSKKNALNIEYVLETYALIEGTGLDMNDVVVRITSHAAFLISQMRKDSLLPWTSTSFFHWLIGECPDTYNEIRAKNGEDSVAVARIPLKVPPPPEEQELLINQPVDYSNPIRRQTTVPSHRASPAVASRQASSSHIFHPSSKYNELPKTTVGILLDLAWAAVEQGAVSSKDRITFSGLARYLNYNRKVRGSVLKIGDYEFCKEIIRYYAKDLIKGLGSDFSGSTLVQDLHLFKTQPPRDIAIGREHLIPCIKALNLERRNTSTHHKSSRVKKSTLITDEDEDSVVRTPAHAAKSILAPHTSGRSSGKKAALRYVPTPAKRDSSTMLEGDENESSNEFDSQEEIPIGIRHKRRRESPFIETGDDAESLTAQTSTLSLVSIALPSTIGFGPNGTWTCPYSKDGCSFVARGTGSEDGKSSIHEHLLEHADGLVKEKLVEQEAGRYHNVDHLLELLRQKGEAARPVVGVLPIKRAMYT